MVPPTRSSTASTPDQRAAIVAARQYGLLTLGQAEAAGLSPTQVRDRCRSKGWHRVARGLYELPGAPARSWRGAAMAGCLLAGPDARASHLTAAALHGLARAPVLPHVTVPPGSSRRTPLVRVHESVLAPVDRAVVGGIPCASASRAVVECGAIVARPELAELVDQAVCAGVASPASILAAVDRLPEGWRGIVNVRAVLGVWSGAIEPGSPAEVRFLRRLLECGVEGAVTQHEIRDHAGAFVARVDVAVPADRHAFEYDSDRYHGPRRFEHDERRHARLQALGWRVDHVAKQDLLPSSTRIADLLAAHARTVRAPRAG